MKKPPAGSLVLLITFWRPISLFLKSIDHYGKNAPTNRCFKKIYVSAAVLLLSATAFSQTILIGLEGESNWVSRAKADARFEVPTTPGAYWYKQSTNTLEPVTDPIGEGISTADNRSAAPELVKRLKELLPSYNVIIVPSAVGGSSIVSWCKGKDLFERAKIMWNDAIAYCNSHSITIDKKYIAWEQGGNDIGTMETDGYYCNLNQLVSDFVSDFGVGKVFGVRIGYDPNYAANSEAEKIMKAHKLVNFNNPDYILSTNEAATFTLADERIQNDLVHFTLKGINQLAISVAEAIYNYETTGQKPQLTEPVASLQNVTSGYINLNPNWSFEFSDNILESNNNVTAKRGNVNAQYDNGALIFNHDGGLTFSRPNELTDFQIDMRLKVPRDESNVILGGVNTLYLERSGASSYFMLGIDGAGYIPLGTSVDWNNFHTIQIKRSNGIISVSVDSIQRLSPAPSTGKFIISQIGSVGRPLTDMGGAFDYFRIKNTVDNVALPVKFKSFKAVNIK